MPDGANQGYIAPGKKVPEYTSLQKAYAALKDSGHYTSGWCKLGGVLLREFPRPIHFILV